MMIVVHNDGPLITTTNYFDTPEARDGYCYLTTNGRCLRLLVPPASAGWLGDMATAEYVILTRGRWTPPPVRQPDGSIRARHPVDDAVELLFEDFSASPFAIQMAPAQLDRLPAREDTGRTDLRCIVYDAQLSVQVDVPARYRRAPRLPWLKAWPTG